MPEHMGVDLQRHLAYTAELHQYSERLGGKTITVRWTGHIYDGQPEFVLVDRPVGCWLPPTVCKSFLLTTVVNRLTSDPPPTRRGYDAWETISALQKAIRRSQPEEAAYWATELQASGYGPWCWSRLRTICVEDVGPADRTLPATIHALETWANRSKDGGGGMEVVTAAILLATAEKSRIACWMTIREGTDHRERIEIADEALDRHTRRGQRLGRSHEHFFNEASKLIDPEAAARSRGYDSSADELSAMEAEAEQHARRLHFDGPDGLPQNPWRLAEPAQNPALDHSGQLRQLRLTPVAERDKAMKDHVETTHFYDEATGELYDPHPVPEVPGWGEDGDDDEDA